MSKPNKKVEFKGVTIPIKWNVPDNIISRYASNVTVQLLENVIRISFFEVMPGIEPDIDVSTIKEVNANCVADIFMSPATIPNYITVLQRQYDAFIKRNKGTISTSIED